MNRLPLVIGAMLVGTSLAIGTRQSLHATQTPAAVLPSAQADGGVCSCGADCQCAEGVCPNCNAQALETSAEDPRLAELEAQLDEINAHMAEMELARMASLIPDLTAVPDSSTIEPDAQPTPYEVIFRAIDLLDLENTETLVDFGCGSDARVLIHAFHDTGCRGIGIELDPDRAAAARNLVRTAGLSPWIQIVEGDAVTTSVQGSVGFVYLWPETLEELRPKLQELDRFISYAHEVPGLDMQRIDVPGHEPLWYWERSPEVSYRAPEVSYAERPYAVYNGRRYYSDYNPSCNCSMCRTIRSQLASRENVERIPTQSTTQSATVEPRITAPVATPQFTTTVQRSTSGGCSNCSGGNCSRPMRFGRGRR